MGISGVAQRVELLAQRLANAQPGGPESSAVDILDNMLDIVDVHGWRQTIDKAVVAFDRGSMAAMAEYPEAVTLTAKQAIADATRSATLVQQVIDSTSTGTFAAAGRINQHARAAHEELTSFAQMLRDQDHAPRQRIAATVNFEPPSDALARLEWAGNSEHDALVREIANRAQDLVYAVPGY